MQFVFKPGSQSGTVGSAATGPFQGVKPQS